MELRLLTNRPRAIFTFLTVLGMDRLSKWWFLTRRPELTSLNSGAALSLGVGRNSFFAVTSWLILSLLFLKARWAKPSLPLVSVALILSGGLSNLGDRLFFGGVVDFLSLGVGPTFNLADTAITLGILLLALAQFPPNRLRRWL